MEVHAHSHTPRKKWTHYFWEFFMLFLAVTLGFFVENQREHLIEHRREKQFIKSYVEDLEADKVRLSFQIPLFQDKISKIDTMVSLISGISPKTGSNRTYLYFSDASWFYKFFPVDRTMQQLKNAGGMRLLRNITAVDSILAYDRETKFIQIHIETSLYKNAQNLKDLEYKLYDFSLIAGWGQGKSRSTLQYPVSASMLSYDAFLLSEYKNKLIDAQRDYASQYNYLFNLKSRAERLIELLKKEYHLK